MIGLIVKGATSLFLEGPDPGPEAAVGLVNRYRMGNSRSFENKLYALCLNHAGRRPEIGTSVEPASTMLPSHAPAMAAIEIIADEIKIRVF